MPQLVILYHSRTGGTAAMAQAAFQGAREEAGVNVRLITAQDATAADLIAADAAIFAWPENLAAMSGEMKAFFGRAYYPALGRIEGRPCALMACAGSDGEGAVRQMARIVTGWRMKLVADPIIICTHAQTPEAILAEKTISEADLARCRDLGRMLAAGLSMGVF